MIVNKPFFDFIDSGGGDSPAYPALFEMYETINHPGNSPWSPPSGVQRHKSLCYQNFEKDIFKKYSAGLLMDWQTAIKYSASGEKVLVISKGKSKIDRVSMLAYFGEVNSENNITVARCGGFFNLIDHHHLTGYHRPYYYKAKIDDIPY